MPIKEGMEESIDNRGISGNLMPVRMKIPSSVVLSVLEISLISLILIASTFIVSIPFMAVDAYAAPLSMSLIDTYQDDAPADSIEGARGMQVDADRSLAFVSSNTDDSLTAINFSNPYNISVYGSVSDSAPTGSLDGIWFGFLDTDNNVFFAPSSADSTTSWYNVSTSTFSFIDDTAADTGGAGSQQGIYDVAIVTTGSTRWLITGGRTDDYISSFNVTNLAATPAVVDSFTDTAGACSVDGVSRVYNVPGTTYVLVAANVDSYITLLNISPSGAISCIGSGYTDTAGSGSIQGFQDFYYEESTGYLYVPGTTDDYFTILENVLSGTPTVVGSVAGITNAYSIAVSQTDFDGEKYAFVGSTTASLGIRVIDVTDPASPLLVSGIFNQTSGGCTYGSVYSLYTSGDYLYATSSADACFYSIRLIDKLMNVTLSHPPDGFYDDFNVSVNLTFNASVTDDDGIVNCSLWTDYSGTWEVNQTKNVGGILNVTNFTLNNLGNKTFIWNIECYDNYGHSKFSESAYDVVLNWSDNPPDVELLSPMQGYTNNAQQYVNLTFNASVSDDKGLLNCSLWTNYSGTWTINQTQAIGGPSNITRFNLTGLTNRTFVWNIQCYDNAFKSSFAETNRTVILSWDPAVDTPPAVSLSSPSNNHLNDTSQYVNITFSAFVTDDFRIVNCSLWTNYSGTWSLNQSKNVGGNINTTSFTLNGLTNKTFVWNVQCYDNASQPEFDTGNRTIILNWTPPLEGNFSIHKYYITLASGETLGFAPFTGGQKGLYAVPFATMRVSFTGTNDYWNLFLPDIYFNSTGVIVERNAGGSSAMDVLVNVVEFDPNVVKVQSGTFRLVSGSNTSSIPANVDLSRSAMVFYYSSTDGTDDYVDNSVRGNISSSNQVTFDVAGTTGVKSGHWYVFESLGDAFSVQNANLDFASTSTSESIGISFIDTSKTFIIASYITSEGSDDSRDGSFYAYLSDSTTVAGTRLGVPAATLNATVFVITFSENVTVRRDIFSYASGVSTDSELVSAYNIDKSMAWNPVLTGRMASDSTTNPIESSFQLLNLSSMTSIDGYRGETAGITQGSWEIIDWVSLHAPVIDSIVVDENIAPVGEIVLSAGSTRFVNCTVAVSDEDGPDGILNATATFYYNLNVSSDPDDNNVHYTNSSCSVAGTNSTSKIFLCGFDVYYHANNGTWICNATSYNSLHYSANNHTNATILPLYALNLTDGISFGNVEPNQESGEVTANITNIGNMPINMTLQGYAVSIGDSIGMNCSDNTNISIDRVKYSLIPSAYVSKTSMNGAPQQLTLTMPKPTSTTPLLNATYWQVSPNPVLGSLVRNCTGFIIFSAEVS